MITNSKVHSAIKKLIVEYKTNTHKACNSSCSLCYLFYDEGRNDKFICSDCPNIIFRGNCVFGCVRRIYKYHYLSWNNPYHKLDEFWVEVARIFKKLRGEYVLTDELENQILSIAEKYK